MASKATTRVEPTLVSEFTFFKDTKNALAFKEDEPKDGTRPPIGSIYVTKKAAVDFGIGRRIRVTVETIADG